MDNRILYFARYIRFVGGRALLVGGCVRDEILGLPPKDYDIEIYGIHSDQLIPMLENIADGNVTQQKTFPVWNLQIRGLDLDVSIPRRDNKIGHGKTGFETPADPHMSIIEAASRRDFTINSMSKNPITGEIFDPYNGIMDLQMGILRETSPSFNEDSSRMYRAIQFLTRHNLFPSNSLIHICKNMQNEIPFLSKSTIWGEFEKALLQGKYWANFFAGIELLLPDFLPMFTGLRYIPQDKNHHPEGTVWIHTVLVTQSAYEISVRENLDDESRIILLLSAICHDLGKLTHTQIDETGKITSHGHAEAGVEPTELFLQTIGCPQKYHAPIQCLVKNHMRHVGAEISPKMVRRLANELHGDNTTIQMLVYLMEADHSGRPPKEKGIPENALKILELANDMNVVSNPPEKIVMGRDLVKLGLKPSPLFSTIIAECYQLQLDGKLTEDNKSDVMQMVVGKFKEFENEYSNRNKKP